MSHRFPARKNFIRPRKWSLVLLLFKRYPVRSLKKTQTTLTEASFSFVVVVVVVVVVVAVVTSSAQCQKLEHQQFDSHPFNLIIQ